METSSSSSEPARTARADLARAVKRMIALLEEDPSLPVLDHRDGVTPTDVAVIASALLRAAEMEIFELALWQAWGIPAGREAARIPAGDAQR